MKAMAGRCVPLQQDSTQGYAPLESDNGHYTGILPGCGSWVTIMPLPHQPRTMGTGSLQRPKNVADTGNSPEIPPVSLLSPTHLLNG
mmetsp:Transcript_38257/g.68296  ORF Transcript_38257/g.68296 Transcript_38257/m.68296 type:complete len:87 (+) Transcript_38257:380-640(+)